MSSSNESRDDDDLLFMLLCLYSVNKSSVSGSDGGHVTDISADFVPDHQLSVDITESEKPPHGTRDYNSRLSMPVIRGGLNSNISDILEASGYGTETDIRVDEDYRFTAKARFPLPELTARVDG